MEAYELLGDLLDYPCRALLHEVNPRIDRVASKYPEAAGLLAEFRCAIECLPLGNLEEIYTGTFDLRAESSLYLGHHLFGEDWKRSALMARLKSWYKEKNFVCGAEMPDHLSVVLRFLGRYADNPDALEFITECLLPAVTRIIAGLQDQGGPYTAGLNALLIIVQTSQQKQVTPGASE
jgi:nitrate reductase molybdenum cofactor assembly chaperone NarJ/NarW